MATSLDEARELISEKKALDADLISELFVIKNSKIMKTIFNLISIDKVQYNYFSQLSLLINYFIYLMYMKCTM
jgi:hypothetical protein